MIGLLGGTFDPPHIAHQVLADEARSALGLEQILWIVTGHPPHKPDRPITDVQHRLAMVELCVHDNPNFEISRIEIDRPGPHYTADTLKELSHSQPDNRWAYIMGKDSLRDLPNWHMPERFIDLTDVIVVLNRPDIEVDIEGLESILPGLKAKLHYIDMPLIEIASRDIRNRVAGGSAYRYLVPHAVADYIEKEGLYR